MESSQAATQFFQNNSWALVILEIWVIFWKGYGLWKAANKRHLVWFIIMLILNTLGIVEILYIYYLNRWDIDKGRLLVLLEKKDKSRKK